VEAAIPMKHLHHDFTLNKYRELCLTLQEKSVIYTVFEYLLKKPEGPVAIVRHDIDRKIGNALRMAKFEHDMGIHSTYYFRYPSTFKPEIIRQVKGFGHEIGYHYEVLAKTTGNAEKAIRLFSQELSTMREVCDIKTICMHGSPLSRYNNSDLWKTYDFQNFGIVGEAYLSFHNTGHYYFTDTGRNWNRKYSVRDMMPDSGIIAPSLETTDDLINWIKFAGDKGIYLTVHPERWAMDGVEWVVGYFKDLIVNTGKSVIVAIQ